MHVCEDQISNQETACESRLSHLLQLPRVDGEAPLLPAPLHPLLSLKRKNSLMVIGNPTTKTNMYIFNLSHLPYLSVLPTSLGISPSCPSNSPHLNSEFLSGFSQFSHTFNLWRNEWWLLSIKKKKTWQAYSAHRRISFPWRWGFPLCRRVSVWWGLTGSVGAEIGCSRDRG